VTGEFYFDFTRILQHNGMTEIKSFISVCFRFISFTQSLFDLILNGLWNVAVMLML